MGTGGFKGFSGKKYGIEASNSTLHYWIRDKLKDWNVMPLVTSEIPWEPRRCPELAYIIGVALGDGSAGSYKRSDRNERRYQFRLMVRDREFAEAVKKAIEGLGLHCNMWEYYERRKESTYYRVDCYVKRFALFLRDIKEHPEKAWQWIEGYESYFIRGFYESEGSLGANGYIEIYNKRREYIDIVAKCLQRLGIKYSILFRDLGAYKRLWIVYIPVHEATKFLAMIKPIIKYSRDDPHYQRVKREREERRRRNKTQRPPQAPISTCKIIVE
ncbi:MAG: hypothetical protein DRN15_00975 [Thermoprotei archaeon]|nr:MAG: hypothetical protein DRM97_03810 [Thermoprotei archaeon]RLF25257.1 MAG: hypothetical protein DRN15_00975 [Thermoprotei archaeon]